MTDKEKNNPRNLNKALKQIDLQIKDPVEKEMMNLSLLRYMGKAKYSLNNIGHFGLAFDYYTHFTSPIRRYPDTMVHRLLTRYAEGGRSANEKHYEELCEHCSDMELVAQGAERDSIKYKQIEYMGDRLDQVFDGTVSGVSRWGIYASENKSKCEGMIRLRDLGDDFFNYVEVGNYILGERTGQTFKIGDRIKIKVLSADLELKQIDYKLVK